MANSITEAGARELITQLEQLRRNDQREAIRKAILEYDAPSRAIIVKEADNQQKIELLNLLTQITEG